MHGRECCGGMMPLTVHFLHGEGAGSKARKNLLSCLLTGDSDSEGTPEPSESSDSEGAKWKPQVRQSTDLHSTRIECRFLQMTS